MDLLQTTWDAYEMAWERRDRRVDDYILMKGITKYELVTTTDSTVNGLKTWTCKSMYCNISFYWM